MQDLQKFHSLQVDESVPSTLNYSIVGWTLSVVIYISIVITSAYMLQYHNAKTVKYTAVKKNLLNVTLVDRKEKKIVQNKKKRVVEKKSTVAKPKPTPKKKTIRAKEAKTKPDFKKLFGKIDLSDIPKDSSKREKKVRQKVVKKEIVKSDKANKITKTLEFEEQESLITTQKDGVYDEFRGKISDILDLKWQETIDTVSGSTAEVIIGIDKLGNFSYKIDTLSYNNAFNAKLRDFLEEMQDEEFPPFKEGEIFRMKVIFKDILE